MYHAIRPSVCTPTLRRRISATYAAKFLESSVKAVIGAQTLLFPFVERYLMFYSKDGPKTIQVLLNW